MTNYNGQNSKKIKLNKPYQIMFFVGHQKTRKSKRLKFGEHKNLSLELRISTDKKLEMAHSSPRCTNENRLKI